MPTFINGGSIEDGVFVNETFTSAPLTPQGGFTVGMSGQGSVLKSISYVVKRGTTANGSDRVLDANNNPVSRRTLQEVLALVDNVGKTYTQTIDFIFTFDPADGTAVIDWSPLGSEPAPTSAQGVSTYTVVFSGFKVSSDYSSKVIGSLTEMVSTYGNTESKTINVVTKTHGVLNSTDTILASSLPGDAARILFIADDTRYYSPGIDFLSNAHIRGYVDPTAVTITAGGPTNLLIDWSPAFAASLEPVPTTGVYTIYFESTTVNADTSAFTLPIAYDIIKDQNTTTVVAVQLNPLDDGTGSPLTSPNLRGTSGFDGASSGQIITAFTNTLTDLFNRSDVQIILPLIGAHKGNTSGSIVPSTYASILDLTKANVVNASALTEGRPRFALMGAPVNTDAPSGVISDGVDIFRNTARAMKNQRFLYCAPSNLVQTYSFGEKTLDGSFVAAAVAGLNSNPNFDAGEPMDLKQLVNITSVEDITTKVQKNQMASDGVLIVDMENGTPTVRQFYSTDPTTVLSITGEVIKISDTIRVALQKSLRGMFIGTRIFGPETLAQIKSATFLILDGFVSRKLISDRSIDSVAVNALDPRQVDIALSVKPILSLKWILVNFTTKI